MVDTQKILSTFQNNSAIGETLLWYALTCIILIIIIVYYFYVSSLRGKEVKTMDTIYGDLNGKIQSIADSPNNYSLRDYYIKTAYNCCSGGSYKNDYVDIQIMKDLLKQGVRGLDFEIYSINDQPVVATSTIDNYHVKETFNYVSFADVMNVIRDYAFSTSTAPNSRDPIIIHLRIKSNHLEMYKNFAVLLKSYDSILLGKEYDSEYNGQNFGAVEVKKLLGKVVIIMEKINTSYLEVPEFYKFINMTSNSVFMKAIRYSDIETMNISATDLIEYNRQNMTICLPNAGADPINPYFNAVVETGCQLVAMRYPLVDENMETNDAYFDDHAHAFVLKPDKLRYIPITIPLPPQQNPELSYATRTVQSDFYKFDI